MIDIKQIQNRLLKKESQILKNMPDRTDASIRRAMRLMAFEVGKIFKEARYGNKKTKPQIKNFKPVKRSTNVGKN